MNLDKGTIKNAAFAIVAIESVWPNPQGNEIPTDFYDFDLLGVDPKQANRAGLKREKFQTSGDATDASEYQEKKGYYKLLPLNIIRASTKSSLTGSTFEVTFTLDDLLLVADSGTDFLNATGLPFSREDLVNLGNQKTLPVLFNDEDKGNWDYVKDEDLGLTRYKINGTSSSFTVEDLVEPNDTVTIWIYHDPSDFYFKNEIPNFVGGNYEINDSIKNVVGSADRRSQFNDSSTSFQDYIVNTLGLANDYTSDVIEAVVEGQESPEINLTLERFLSALDSFVLEGLESLNRAVNNFNAKEQFKDFSDGFGVPSISTAYRFLLEPYVFPSGTTAPESILVEDNFSRLFREFATRAWNGSTFEYTGEVFPLSAEIPAYRIQTLDDEISTQNFIIGLNNFKSYLEDVSSEYINESLKNREYSFVEQRFSNGRQALVTDFTGETPYLALKGKISDISTSVGHKPGSYAVTITGSGYEKTLNEQEVFYEDVFFPSSYRFMDAEYVSKYLLISPPRALIDVINRHAAKNLIFKPKDDLSPLEQASYFSSFVSIRPDLNEINKNFDNVGKFFSNNVVARGNFLASEYTENLSKDDIRVFYPVNFLDTTRIYEMVRALDAAYVDQEAFYRHAMSLRGGTSVFQNLKMLGGTEQFYEMFVDETGKFRYRFTFEAYERTPKPSVTPIIQDEDLLPGSQFNVTDSRVSTSITVVPSKKAVTGAGFDIPFLGRATPNASPVPIKNISIVSSGEETPGLQNPRTLGTNTVDLEGTLSSTLFRYGMQSLKIEDVYTAPGQDAKRKAILYLNLFGEPLKQARISMVNNTSYRVGNTVLVSLQKNKHRSKTFVDVQKFTDWLKYIKTDEELINYYVGFDERLILKDTYLPTSSGDYSPIPSFYDDFVANPKLFVLNRFIETFDYLLDTLNLNVITPEYFPSTYWFYNSNGEGFVGSDGRIIPSNVIKEFYDSVLNLTVNNVQSESASVEEKIASYPSIVDSLKFQDFRVASYYIENVSHKFEHGRDASTSLSLNYGQDNLVLLEPRNNLPIGFISLERNLKLGYDSPEQDKLYLEGKPGERSGEQNMFLEQFKQNESFENASVMYQAQKIRNASNYMYKLGIVENLDTESNEFSQDVRSSREIIENYETNTTTFVGAPDVDTRSLSADFYADAGTTIAQFEVTNQNQLPAGGLPADVIESLEQAYNESGNAAVQSAVEDFVNQDLPVPIDPFTALSPPDGSVVESPKAYVERVFNSALTKFNQSAGKPLLDVLKEEIGGGS